MKRMSIWFALFAVFLWTGSAVASPAIVSFSDSANYWPNWANHTGDDSRDTIGTPDFSGGQVTFSGNLLTDVTFYNKTTSDSLWGVLSPGDLFLDVGSNGTWDYVVDITDWTVAGPDDPDPGYGSYNIYPISEKLGSPSTSTNYILSGSDNKGAWSGYDIRDAHPVAYNDVSLSPVGDVYFSGWDNSPTTQYAFDFTYLTGGGLPISGGVTIGWATNCANEVIYEKVPNPVPEPSTMLMLGAGFLGLASIGKKKFLKKG